MPFGLLVLPFGNKFEESFLSPLVFKLFMPRSSGFPTRSYTNRSVQPQEMARSLKVRIYEVEGFYYPCSENKGADQLRGYREADLHLCFHICKNRFSHDAAHLKDNNSISSDYSRKCWQTKEAGIFESCFEQCGGD